MEQLAQLLHLERGPEATLLRQSFHFIRHELEARRVGDSSTRHNAPAALDIENSPLARLDGSGSLTTGSQSRQQNQIGRLEHWIESCIAELGLRLEKHCNLFHLIANVATLLGLLGTVTGMIYAFGNGALGQSSQLAQGISQALVTTAGGLIVAIPAIVSQQLFLNTAALRVSALEQLGHEILSFQHRRLGNVPYVSRPLPAEEAKDQSLPGNARDLAKLRATPQQTALHRQSSGAPPASGPPPRQTAGLSAGDQQDFTRRLAELRERRSRLYGSTTSAQAAASAVPAEKDRAPD